MLAKVTNSGWEGKVRATGSVWLHCKHMVSNLRWEVLKKQRTLEAMPDGGTEAMSFSTECDISFWRTCPPPHKPKHVNCKWDITNHSTERRMGTHDYKDSFRYSPPLLCVLSLENRTYLGKREQMAPSREGGEASGILNEHWPRWWHTERGQQNVSKLEEGEAERNGGSAH